MRKVTPLAGVWIEINTTATKFLLTLSLPLRECGLKFTETAAKLGRDIVTPLAGVWIEINKVEAIKNAITVTPLAGVWIEILHRWPCGDSTRVTPLAGVWIEIYIKSGQISADLSLPLRECGLKFFASDHLP